MRQQSLMTAATCCIAILSPDTAQSMMSRPWHYSGTLAITDAIRPWTVASGQWKNIGRKGEIADSAILPEWISASALPPLDILFRI
ncbi:hypothetical protein ACFOKF_11090 [Sphingobium rhizovicinum]|uniref:Secreted protein n=1 Tax=Sphingobium rhizovicinum TaxID=432308 RepID=A0ABV7NG55_9SPHN